MKPAKPAGGKGCRLQSRRGRSQRVATQQQVYGRLALEHLGPGFEASKTGGLKTTPEDEDVTGRESA